MMSLDQRMTEAAREIRAFAHNRPLPVSGPPRPVPPRRRVRPVLVLAGLAAIVGLVAIVADRPMGETIDATADGRSRQAVLPFDDIEAWTYTIVESDIELPLARYEIGYAAGLAVEPSGEVGWPLELFEPWRVPTDCTDAEPLRLPTRTDLARAGQTEQTVSAECDGRTIIGAVRARWSGVAEDVTVAAGVFSAVRVDIDASGFTDPFGLQMSLWIDADVGVVRHVVQGSAPGPDRLVTAELVEIDPAEPANQENP